MLVLSRKLGESLVIAGQVVLTVIEIKDGKVRIGIEAPIEISVDRAEIAEAKRLHPRTLD